MNRSCKFVVLLLLPLLMLGFLSVCYSQLTVDNSIISLSGDDWSLKVDGALASSVDSRNTPYMVSKSATEKELFLQLSTLEDCKSGVVQFKVDMTGLTYFKQLPLTQKEIDEGSFRPKNVENSYACFDSSGRKVLHIYGSKIVDAKGTEVWLDQDLADGLLTVYLPKSEVLETLTFPLLLDPTFGKTDIGGTAWETENDKIRACKFTLSDDNVSVFEIWAYLECRDGSSSPVVFGIYDDNSGVPNNLVGQSVTTTFDNSAGWVNASCDIDITNSGTYWLALHSDLYHAVYYDSGSAAQYKRNTVTYTGTLPDPFGTPDESQDRVFSIYANYTITASPTPTPTASPTPSPTASPEPSSTPLSIVLSEYDWINFILLFTVVVNLALLLFPFALVRFVFGALSLSLNALAFLESDLPFAPYLQIMGLVVSAVCMFLATRARE